LRNTSSVLYTTGFQKRQARQRSRFEPIARDCRRSYLLGGTLGKGIGTDQH
jgi:hypothetical protein